MGIALRLRARVLVPVALGAAVLTGLPGPSYAASTSGPDYEMPFPCGDVWNGSSRYNHSPSALAIDWNRPDDLGAIMVAAAPGVVTSAVNLGQPQLRPLHRGRPRQRPLHPLRAPERVLVHHRPGRRPGRPARPRRRLRRQHRPAPALRGAAEPGRPALVLPPDPVHDRHHAGLAELRRRAGGRRLGRQRHLERRRAAPLHDAGVQAEAPREGHAEHPVRRAHRPAGQR